MIIGHQKQWEFLKFLVKIKKIPHALLFVGPEKIGKKTLALEFASLILKQSLRGHPDFVFLEPINGEIKISQIRELILRLSLKKSSAPFKIVIIDNAHLMNFQAQNCFLKTLEEPKGESVLILITSFLSGLLPTLVSRCQIMKFYPLSKREIKEALLQKGVEEDLSEKLAGISLGCPGMVFELVSNREEMQKFKKAIKDLLEILNSDLKEKFEYAKKISQEPQEILKIWLLYLRTLLSEKLEGKEPKAFHNFSLKEIVNIIEFIEETYFLITFQNLNKRLALENLMLKI